MGGEAISQTQKPQLLVQLEALTRSGYPECDVGFLGDFLCQEN